jgi:hypothetical protein
VRKCLHLNRFWPWEELPQIARLWFLRQYRMFEHRYSNEFLLLVSIGCP